jgi:acyl-CoA reductase-like NAD-dependent aldehyde dehydrogenase
MIATVPECLRDRAELYVDGEWTALGHVRRILVEDPSTEEALGSVPDVSNHGVELAVAAARRAFEPWAAIPATARAAALERLADLVDEAAAELGAVIAREVGMPLAQATEIQARLPVAVLRSAADEVRRHPLLERQGRAQIHYEPAGVVAAITPWNFPLHQIAAKIGPALAAGCTVVLKPSELAPFNAFLLAELVARAGIPPGVFNLVTGRGPSAGEALVAHPDVDVVSLTGSVRAGRRVGELAGGGLKRVALELGGKSPSVVLDDADLEEAVRHDVQRGFLNAGQACNACTRVIVPAERLAEAEEIAADEAAKVRVGPALAPESTMGPLVSAAQRERVVGFIRDGIDSGARLVTGGPEPPEGLERGYFVRPTVFSDVDPHARVAREEIFGPVLCLFGHRGEDDAVALANDTEFGLAAEVWTADPERAQRIARRLRAGQVKLNGVRTRDALSAPFGGFKQSGVGRELGRWGLEEFLEVKAVLGA